MPFYPYGAPITLTTTIRDPTTGAPADPTDLSLVIRDPANVDTTYDYPGPIVRDSVGVFHLPLAAPVLAGHYQARWISTGAAAGALETVLDVLVAFQPALCDLSDLKTTLGIPAATTAFDDELRRYIVAATSLVESLIGGPVITRQVTEAPVRLAGCVLVLATANPVTITSITSIPDAVTVDVTGTWLDAAVGLVHLKLAGSWAGRGPYSVVMQAGLGLVPAEVSLAAQIIIQHIWETQHAPANAPGVLGNETPAPFLGAFAVPNRAKELLAPYLTVGIG